MPLPINLISFLESRHKLIKEREEEQKRLEIIQQKRKKNKDISYIKEEDEDNPSLGTPVSQQHFQSKR